MNKETIKADGIEVHCGYDEIVHIETLLEHPQNPNRHPEKQIKLLSNIIKKQGWRNCIVVSKLSGYITRGHGRLMAAKRLGLREVPVQVQSYSSESAELADLVADNKIRELSNIDNDLLLAAVQGIEDVEICGYEKGELDELMALSEAEEGGFKKLMESTRDNFSVSLQFDNCELRVVSEYLESHNKKQLVEQFVTQIQKEKQQ